MHKHFAQNFHSNLRKHFAQNFHSNLHKHFAQNFHSNLHKNFIRICTRICIQIFTRIKRFNLKRLKISKNIKLLIKAMKKYFKLKPAMSIDDWIQMVIYS